MHRVINKVGLFVSIDIEHDYSMFTEESA